MKKLLTVFAINLLILSVSYAQNKVSNEIKQIDRYVKNVNSITRKQKEPSLIFADISQTAKAKWRKFASSKSLEKFRNDKAETYTISNNWTIRRKIIISVFTLFSESGDWVHYIYYYFRQNGTLAKIESEYRTFYGHFAALQNFYFNEKGKNIKKTIKYRDLETGKRKKVDKNDLADNSNLFEIDFYRKTSNLPFAFLLGKK